MLLCFQSKSVSNKSVGFHYFTPIKTVVLELVIATVYGFLKSSVLYSSSILTLLALYW